MDKLCLENHVEQSRITKGEMKNRIKKKNVSIGAR